jgi:hypothetical protein
MQISRRNKPVFQAGPYNTLAEGGILSDSEYLAVVL